MSWSSIRRRAALRTALLLACSVIGRDTPARSQPRAVALPQLFGPCTAPMLSAPANSGPDGPNNGSNVLAAVPADFDEDGRLDLAVITGEGRDPFANTLGSVEIWKGQGQGQFSFGVPVVTSSRTNTLAAADLNTDGHADVLYSVPASRTLVVHLGDGAGAMGPGSSVSLSCAADDIAVDDLNGDTAADVMVSCGDVDPLATRGSVVVLPGDGAGGLGPPTVVALDARPGALAVADLNLDTHADAVVADPERDAIWVLLGDESGGLAISAHLAVGAKPRDVQVADVNADGTPDILTANALSHDVSVLIGLEGGGYAPQAVFPAADAPASLATADLNGDGDVDLAVADEGTQAVAVLLGGSGGAFGAPTAFHVLANDWGPVSVTAADLTADGRPDLVSANGHANAVSALLNLCDVAHADLGFASVVADPSPVPFNELVTDTLVVTNQGPDLARDLVVRVLPGAESVSLSASQGSCGPDVSGWSSCAVGDLAAGATATAWLVQRASNPYHASFSAEVTSQTLDSDINNNGWFQDTRVIAVGGLDLRLGLLENFPHTVNLMWSGGSLQTGFVLARWVDGVAAALPPRLDASAINYWDRNPVLGALNCYFVVALDDLGSLGHSTTLCLVPDVRSSTGYPERFSVRMGPPDTNLTRLDWEAPYGRTGYALMAVPMVEAATPRWTTYGPDDQIAFDDTGGVTTCYVLFAFGAGSSLLGYSNADCVVPGSSTVAPRGAATTWPVPTVPDGLRFGAARLRTLVEEARARLASRR